MAYRYSTTPKIDDLTDAELLAYFLPNSKTNRPIDRARNMINDAGSLTSVVYGCSKGMKYLKPAQLDKVLSGVELGKRIAFENVNKSDVLSSPQDVRDFLSIQLGSCPYELLCVILMDNRHRVIEFVELFRGTVDSAACYPREIARLCLYSNANSIILAHNHPSKMAEPSDTDVRLTRKVIDSLALIDVRVLDHLVIGGGVQTSLAERGLM